MMWRQERMTKVSCILEWVSKVLGELRMRKWIK
jgi:hypothetical protein